MRATKSWVALVSVMLCQCATTAEHQAVNSFERVEPALLRAGPQVALKKASFQDIPGLEHFALQRNPEVRAAYLEWKAAVTAIPSARRWPATIVRYSGLPLPIETKVGPQEHRLGVAQAIPWPGKMAAAADLLASKAVLAARRFEAARVAVLRDLRGPLFKLVALEAQQRILKEQLVLMKQISISVQARQSIGKASLAQVARVVLLMGRLEERVARLAAMSAPLQARIRGVAGLTPDSALPRVAQLPPIVPLGISSKELRRRLEDHPKARIHAAAAAVQRAVKRRASSARYPDFGLGVDWMIVGTGGATDAAAGTDSLMAMLTVKIPLSLGAYEAAESAAELRAQAAEVRREAVLANAQTLIVGLTSRIAEAARREQVFDKTLAPQASIALEAALVSYSAARGDFKDLFFLAKQLLEYRYEVVLAQTDHALARVGLDYLMGAELTPPARPKAQESK